jgi:hypothetical protein
MARTASACALQGCARSRSGSLTRRRRLCGAKRAGNRGSALARMARGGLGYPASWLGMANQSWCRARWRHAARSRRTRGGGSGLPLDDRPANPRTASIESQKVRRTRRTRRRPRGGACGPGSDRAARTAFCAPRGSDDPQGITTVVHLPQEALFGPRSLHHGKRAAPGARTPLRHRRRRSGLLDRHAPSEPVAAPFGCQRQRSSRPELAFLAPGNGTAAGCSG